MPRQTRPAARHAESHDAHIASRRQDHYPGDEEMHHERDAVEQTAGAVEGLHTARDVDERESNGDGQRGNITTAGPYRHPADGCQRREAGRAHGWTPGTP